MLGCVTLNVVVTKKRCLFHVEQFVEHYVPRGTICFTVFFYGMVEMGFRRLLEFPEWVFFCLERVYGVLLMWFLLFQSDGKFTFC